MAYGIDYNARLSLKIKSIVKSTIRMIWKHLLLVSIVNILIAIWHNYVLKTRIEEQLNVVAYLLRGTFVSSIPSCVTLFLLICCTEYNWNNRSYKEWNLMNVITTSLIFYSIAFTKSIFSKDPVNIYEVMYLVLVSYMLQYRFNLRKLKADDYQFYVTAGTENIHLLFKKGILLNAAPIVFSYAISFILDVLLAIVNSLSFDILLSILTHPFEVFLNIPTLYNLINIYQMENYSYALCVFSSIWITTLLEYHFILFNFVFSKCDPSIVTSLNDFPMHNKAPYDDEYFVVSCIHDYLKDISYRVTGKHVEITNMDKTTQLKLLLFKKMALLKLNLQKNDDDSIKMSSFRNPFNTMLLEDTQIWSLYVQSCILCMEDLIDQLKKYVNILNHDETIFSYEEKEVRGIFEKTKIRKLKDTIRLTCMYFKGLSLWTVTVSIVCRDMISSYVRKLAAMLIGLSFVLFDFLNFVKINELFDMLHVLLYEINGLIEVFKCYKEDILDNKYQYSYNLYKGLSYMFRNETIAC